MNCQFSEIVQGLQNGTNHISSKKKKGAGIAAVAGVGRVNGEDRVVEQLVDGSINSTLTQNHV